MLRDFSLRDFGASLNTVESYTNESSQGKIGLCETVNKQKCTHLGMFLASDGIIGWDGSDEKVNVAVLLNYGYRVKKDVWFKNIENFGYRTGAYFVEDGVADFNQSNPYGIKVTIIRPDSYLV